MPTYTKIVLATHNKGKIKEFKAALTPLGYEAIAVSDILTVPEPEETGTTFMGNAILKATYYMKATQLPCMADDSGIVVDALQGAPGIYSARYAGPEGNDAKNNGKLLQALKGVPVAQRSARYVCALVLCYPGGAMKTTEATCEGFIQEYYVGTGGFGYDPLFYVREYEKTMAELTLEEKNKISHRGKALRQLVELLK